MTPLLGKEIEEPELISPPEIEDQISAELEEEALPFAEKEREPEREMPLGEAKVSAPAPVSLSAEFFTIAPAKEEPAPVDEHSDLEQEPPSLSPEPKSKPLLTTPWRKSESAQEILEELPPLDMNAGAKDVPKAATPAPLPEAEPPKLKLGVKPTSAENELSLDSSPRGRFEGETPNLFEGEDLDLPPFLRKKK